MSLPPNDLDTLSRVCVNGVCHCDWRLTVQDCVESKTMTIVNAVNVGFSGIAIVIGIGLLGHRMIIKGHRLFEINLSKGCFRPKPIDCMLLFIIFFNLLRLISSAVLISDVCPNMVFRSFMFELPWQFGFGAFALYLTAIAQTLADSHRAITTSWLPSPFLVDLIGGTIFLAPFIINNVVSLVAGILAEKNLYLAQVFTRLLYVFWFIHCFSLSSAVLFSGYRLICILGAHLKQFKTTGPRYVSMQTSIFKIRAVMGIITICLGVFAIFLLVFGILREVIIVDVVGSIVLGTIWSFLGVVATLGVELTIIFNPKVEDDGTFGLQPTKAEKSASRISNFNNFAAGSSDSHNSSSGTQGTLNPPHALDDMKSQQYQYPNAFHNEHSSPDAKGIPSQDTEHHHAGPRQSSLEKRPFPFSHHQSHHLDDEPIIDDGETSQMDLVQSV